MLDVAKHDVAMHYVAVHEVGMQSEVVHSMDVPGVGIQNVKFVSGKKLIFDAHWRKKANFFNYMSLNKFLQIKRWKLIENIKTTLLTHP